MRTKALMVGMVLIASGCADTVDDGDAIQAVPVDEQPTGEGAAGAVAHPAMPEETHLANMQRLTQGGSNSEAYFSADGSRIIFQATREGQSECDQIYTMDVDGTNVQRVSTGGRTTCGYFYPSGDRILYSSTHHINEACPAPPDRTRGYVWALEPYDVFTANPDGSDLRQITDDPEYDAEATISPDGSQIVFTSLRDGDLNVYVMNADGTNVRQLTDEVGYDGGAFFSADGSQIVYRAHHPTDEAEIADYQQLLQERLVRPNQVEIFVMDADGSNKRQLTSNGAANFAPFYHPDGERIIFSSNIDDPQRRSFSLYLLDIESGEVERVTHGSGFDSFPMFSPDGSQLMFASDRGAGGPGQFDIYLADWVD
jgi:TolB protein